MGLGLFFLEVTKIIGTLVYWNANHNKNQTVFSIEWLNIGQLNMIRWIFEVFPSCSRDREAQTSDKYKQWPSKWISIKSINLCFIDYEIYVFNGYEQIYTLYIYFRKITKKLNITSNKNSFNK